MVRGAIFDLDGTLIDSMFIYENMAQEMLAESGIEAPADIRHRMRKMTLLQMAQYTKSEFGLSESVEEIIQAVVDRIVDFYTHEVETKPGVKEMLAEFERMGVKMCIVTVSERPVVEAALRRNDILKYISKIITCGEVGHDKNRPDIYRAALEYLGTDKSETVVFEDELHTVETAKNDGFTVFGVADASVPEQDQVKELCDLYITDYHAQLEDIINW
ncbi:MAG: HAD family phosphatase [Clostridiales bacterium]|nr:HAD family phosphatase [Candidatus Crickella equi]